MTLKNKGRTANRRLAQWRVTWLIEHSTSHQLLWSIDSFVLRNPPLRQAPNRNLIAVGERLHWDTIGFNAQQAWLIKLDQYGCLTPGCHLVSTKNEYKEHVKIKIYPNPATEFITFYIDDDIKLKVNQYCIRDMKGQLIKEVRSLLPDIHYVIHTHDFPSGMYIIQFLKDGQIVKSEKIIVSH